MLKNILVILGIVAITSSSAFAATKAAKGTTPIVHKVAQPGHAERMAKADKKVNKAKAHGAAKAAKPAAETPSVEPAK